MIAGKKASNKSMTLFVIIPILIILTVFFLFPFFMLITRSLMTTKEAISLQVSFLPKGLNFASFSDALTANFFKYAKNSLIVLVVNVIAVPLSAYICAYGFSRVKFVGKDVIFAIGLATMMIPGIVVQIPIYKLFVDIGWVNTLLPLTIPSLFGGGMINIFLIRQYLKSIPAEFDKAASIDGANTWQIMFKIILPIAKPVVALVGVNTFLGVWNDFTSPLIYITDENYFTIPIGVFMRFKGAISAFETMPNVQMATGLIMMVPTVIIFSLFQNQLIEGVSIGGIKG